MEEKKYLGIEVGVVQALLGYLSTQPYNQVNNLISILSNLPAVVQNTKPVEEPVKEK